MGQIIRLEAEDYLQALIVEVKNFLVNMDILLLLLYSLQASEELEVVVEQVATFIKNHLLPLTKCLNSHLQWTAVESKQEAFKAEEYLKEITKEAQQWVNHLLTEVILSNLMNRQIYK